MKRNENCLDKKQTKKYKRMGLIKTLIAISCTTLALASGVGIGYLIWHKVNGDNPTPEPEPPTPPTPPEPINNYWMSASKNFLQNEGDILTIRTYHNGELINCNYEIDNSNVLFTNANTLELINSVETNETVTITNTSVNAEPITFSLISLQEPTPPTPPEPINENWLVPTKLILEGINDVTEIFPYHNGEHYTDVDWSMEGTGVNYVTLETMSNGYARIKTNDLKREQETFVRVTENNKHLSVDIQILSYNPEPIPTQPFELQIINGTGEFDEELNGKYTCLIKNKYKESITKDNLSVSFKYTTPEIYNSNQLDCLINGLQVKETDMFGEFIQIEIWFNKHPTTEIESGIVATVFFNYQYLYYDESEKTNKWTFYSTFTWLWVRH